MNRREYVTVIGTTGLTSIAGCVGELGRTPSIDDDQSQESVPSNEEISLSDEKAMAVGEKVQNAVVQIRGTDRRGVSGTGWFIDDSTVITNAHVARQFSGFQVETFAGNTFDASLIGTVESMQPDVAALSVEIDGESSYTSIETGDSSKLEQGDPVIQVGHPGSIGWWVISLGAFLSRHEIEQWLLSTVPTLSGNSGSPLVTASGVVVGLTSGETYSKDVLKDYRTEENTVFRRYPVNTRATHTPIEVVEEKLSMWR